MKILENRNRAAVVVAGACMICLMGSSAALAQFGPPPAPPGPAKDVAPIDLTGQWVSIVTEDWRFRMVTPPKNDYPGLPLNAAARAVADAWDPAQVEAEGNACKSYGAAAIMRVPGRIRISWEDDSTLEIQTDAGRQTRLFHFDGTAPETSAEKTWQGNSKAEWILHSGGRGRPPVNGTIKVVTTGMKAGFLRKNGVPYSEDAVVTEWYDLFTQHDGTQWLQILTRLDDPTYFDTPVITSTNFRREDDRRAWDPQPCMAQ
jgi:hypothetical protein